VLPMHAVSCPHAPCVLHVWKAVLLEHCTAPGVQSPVQAPPTHASLLHVDVDVSKTHVWPFSTSDEHTASVVSLVQMSPAVVQGAAGLQVHEDVDPFTVHVWLLPHVSVVIHSVQPFDCTWQVWTVGTGPLTHCVAPFVHALVQHEAEPALPEQAPFVHGDVDAA
jgi:hypothetical protein